MTQENEDRRPKCVGVPGLLFGHKFIDSVGNYTGCCLRCGMPQGGSR